jgi:hypothetical protein
VCAESWALAGFQNRSQYVNKQKEFAKTFKTMEGFYFVIATTGSSWHNTGKDDDVYD